MKDYSTIPGLLFYLSGENGFEADFAGGRAGPTFLSEVEIIDDGVNGKAFQCGEYQKMAYKAPGNIYAARGTLSFFWRSRYPVGPTEFPIFRVGCADHSSWDACWLRIDYNGRGFEAFVTDINLSRARVAVAVEPFPKPDEWIHLALSWDETWGIRFYVNGKLAVQEYRPAVYFTGLDQFGPHSRIIANWNVISDYNFIRGGDIDELAIYDRALSDANVVELARGSLPTGVPPLDISMGKAEYREEWLLRQGWLRYGQAGQKETVYPGLIPDRAGVRKVEIHEAYDHKRWWWKALDGIRETTWPGVYNRSRLKGRNDYFQLPDWDCYSVSGKSITFHMPREPFNHLEISGSAYGTLEVLNDDGSAGLLCERPAGQERTTHDFDALCGGRLRFTNREIEEPIGDFSAFYVGVGEAPAGLKAVRYTLRRGFNGNSPAGKALVGFIQGRYAPYERGIMTAVEKGSAPQDLDTSGSFDGGFPFVNIIVPYEADRGLGLDGVELEIPAVVGLSDRIPFAVQIKDPLWYYRNLAYFSFSVEPGHAKKIWFDLRDRILPAGRSLYITIACADSGFGPAMMEGSGVRLVYKSADAAKAEHCADRFVQVKDCYAHLVEEQPGLPEFDMFNRFAADVNDLLDVYPGHKPAQYYYYDKFFLQKKYDIKDRRPGFTLDYKTAPIPAGVPAWAFKQIEFLKHYKYLINFYIDNRQIENGEFGGGLSDDGDYTAMWVGLVNMDSDREKVRRSHLRCLDAFYEQGMFTNGMPSIQSDELHSAEEGLIALGQALTLDFANPKLLERAMETARALWWITGVNKAGHRLIRSSYFSGSKMAVESPWGLQRPNSPLAFSPAAYIVRFNGNEKLKKLWVEWADGLMAHRKKDGTIHSYIRFEDNENVYFSQERPRETGVYILLYIAYRFTGDRKYFDAIPKAEKWPSENMFAMDQLKKFFYESLDEVPVTSKEAVAAKYEEMNFIAGIREYYNTLGHPWIDRVYFESGEIQYDRLGGVSHKRGSCVYPMNRIRWEFANIGDDEKVAILTPCATDDRVKLVVYNLSDETVKADVIGFEVNPGTWRIVSGIDSNGDDKADRNIVTREEPFERSARISVSFAPRFYTIITMEKISPGTDYWSRPDLGIGKDDVRFYPHGMNVRIHSLGGVDSPPAIIALKNSAGKILKACDIPPIEAPKDLWPRYWDVIFNLHGIESLEGCYLEIDPEKRLTEITRENNIVWL
jgi:hypothetical protein